MNMSCPGNPHVLLSLNWGRHFTRIAAVALCSTENLPKCRTTAGMERYPSHRAISTLKNRVWGSLKDTTGYEASGEREGGKRKANTRAGMS